MAGEGRHDDRGKPGNPEIAAAEGLFRDVSAGQPAKPHRDTPPDAGPSAGETFDLADSPFAEAEAEAEAVASPIPVVPTRDPSAARPRDSARPKTARPIDSPDVDGESLVEEVWSRRAEWGPNLVIVGAWLFVVFLILYFLGWDHFGLGFIVFLIGAAGALVLSYPILITLERPVRITPEQAVRDFYAALSHHFPHYRRMWLLLARTGRTSSSFGSFEGFKAYWNEKIQTIKGSQAGAMTPLVFEVENYRGDKSAGKSRAEIKFTLKIFIRGRRQAGPVSSIPAQMSVVRGPDKMWYLESGTLPHAQRESRSE
jgi:hypothetical protein